MFDTPLSKLPHSSNELAGKTAVVTGAASGIGRAIALELARAGADVLVHTRANRAAAEEAAGRIREWGRRAEVVLIDLAQIAAHEALVERAWAWGGEVDFWINNAGADVLTGAAAQWSFDDKLRALWQVDVRATIRLARSAGDRMRRAGGPAGSRVVVNMGWDQAVVGMAGDSGELFAAAKGAVMAFSLSLARSLAPTVRVLCLAPGWIRTAWADQASAYWDDRARREALLGRWGQPEDVAAVARFLCSPGAAFLTGQTIPINGGSARGAVENDHAP